MSEESNFNPIERYPLLIVISGPSGVGKDSVLTCLKDRKAPFHFVVTATTRPAREGERNGIDYHFVSTDEFAEMINRGELLEYSIVYDDYKGIPNRDLRAAMESGLDVILRIDVQGAAKLKNLYPDVLLIFLTTRTAQELADRLTDRKSEKSEGLNLRIATAVQELKRIHEFDYVVVNGDSCLEETVDTILAIIKAEHHRVNPRKVSV